MNKTIEKEYIKIEDMIYEIRGKQVMLDRDLAKLYKVETRTLNQKVKRNLERFPEKFCFRLTKEEWENLKSQIVISSKKITKHIVAIDIYRISNKQNRRFKKSI